MDLLSKRKVEGVEAGCGDRESQLPQRFEGYGAGIPDLLVSTEAKRR